MSLWSMITGNLGGFANAITGGTWNPFGQSTQQQQMQFATAQAEGAFLPQFAANERAAGINPAGSGMMPPAVSFPGGEGFSGSPLGTALGGTLNRALSAGSVPETKMDQLQQRLLESQITHSDLLNKQLAQSMVARSLSTPDLPFFGGTGRGIPLPPEDPRGLGKGRPNLWTDYYDNPTGAGPGNVTLLSPEAQRSVFSGVPTAPIYPAIAAALTGKNVGNAARTLLPPWLSDYVP